MVWATFKHHWANHSSRAIENELDMLRLPFLRHDTIGPGSRTLVNGPIAKEESQWPGDHLISLRVYSKVDEARGRSALPICPSRP